MKNKQMERAIQEARKNIEKREGYGMRTQDVIELANLSKDSLFDAITSSFDYGFAKGMRFARAMNRALEG